MSLNARDGVKFRQILTIVLQKYGLELQDTLKFNSTLFGTVTKIDKLIYTVTVDKKKYTNVSIDESLYPFVKLNDLVILTVPNNNKLRITITSKIKTVI